MVTRDVQLQVKFSVAQLIRKLDGARLAVVEGVVVEEDFLEAGEVLERVLALGRDIVGRSQAPAMAGMRLRPQAERAHGRTAARGVKRDERIQQKRNVVAPEIQVALVDFGHPGQLIQILDDAAFRVVDDLAVLPIADAGKFRKRRAFGVIGDLIIELAPHHEIDGFGSPAATFPARW